MNRRKKIRVCSSLLIACFLMIGFCRGWVCAADDYPSRAINVLIGVPPGGSTDMSLRTLAQFMEAELKQPVIVANKPGAAGTIAGYAVSSAKPDGYTLGYFPGSGAFPEMYSYFYSAPYSSKDLKPIASVHVPAITIAVKADGPWNSLKELVEYARKNPGMKFGHIGKSTIQYVAMAQINKQEDLKMVDVPFDGDATMVPALLGGHIPVGTPVYPVIKAMVDAKKLKVLAICLRQRAPSAPDIPTVPELGYKLAYVPFFALYAPVNTPEPIIKKLEATVRKVVNDKEFLAKSKLIDMPVEHEDGANLVKYIAQYQENITSFFKSEGFVK
jgi:tripartite-type tricarboxylate transporter receptor subunit TctC